MNPVSDHVTELLHELLEQHRIVVWYDPEKVFAELARDFTAPKCVVIDAGPSALRARREADAVFLGMSDPAQLETRDRNLLIYVPAARTRTEEKQIIDPFEVYAVLGISFGDKPAQYLQSLAVDAMRDRAAEVDRLFAEGRPTLALLDGLKAGASFPLLAQSLGTDSPVEVAAALLSRKEIFAEWQEIPGMAQELKRLLRGGFGFHAPAAPLTASLTGLGVSFGRYVLLSEFAFDLAQPLPDALRQLPRAPAEHRGRIFALCDRLRCSDDTRDAYVDLARREEDSLRLRDLCAGWTEFGERDTFAFEERHSLARVQALAKENQQAKARAILEGRRPSVWSQLGPRAVLWKLAERCLDFLDAAHAWNQHAVPGDRPLAEHLRAYTERDTGHWQLDRAQRLVEQGAAHGGEDEEIAALVALCRSRYLEVAGEMQAAFLAAVRRYGWPAEGAMRQTQVFDRHVRPAWQSGTRTAYFLVDSLRYEMGNDLAQALEAKGAVSLMWATTVLPATTPCGMAALMPGADGAYRLIEKDDRLLPEIDGQVLADSAARMALLKARYGDRVADLTLGTLLSRTPASLRQAFRDADLLVVRTGELDTLGEVTSLYHARKQMSGILREVVMAVDRLAALNYRHFVFAADHGHVLLPEVPAGDVIIEPPGRWLLSKRRCRIGVQTAPAAGAISFPTAVVGIDCPAPDFVVPAGFKVFQSGEGYFHEGLSLQECVVPILTLAVDKLPEPSAPGSEIIVRYRATRFTGRVISVKVWFNSLTEPILKARLEVYGGSGSKAKLVGEAADCDARDPSTGVLTLPRGQETQVPMRIEDDFTGDAIELRLFDAATPGLVLARLMLENAIME